MNLTDQNFEQEIKSTQKPVLVDFFAAWCEPCKMLAPVLHKVAEDLKEQIIFAQVNVDDFPMTSQKYGIERIPTVALFKNGAPASGFTGFRQEGDIKQWLKDNGI